MGPRLWMRVSAAVGIIAGVPARAADPPPHPRDGTRLPAVTRELGETERHESAEEQRERANAPARVTSDTIEYCSHLAGLYELLRHDRARDAAGDALARDGAAMCDQGQVRMGVRALRRALVGFSAQP